MTDYESIYDEAYTESCCINNTGPLLHLGPRTIDHDAGLSAVVAAAKAEAATEAAEDFDQCLCTDEPRQDCAHHGDSTARYVGEHIVGQLRARAETYREGN